MRHARALVAGRVLLKVTRDIKIRARIEKPKAYVNKKGKGKTK